MSRFERMVALSEEEYNRLKDVRQSSFATTVIQNPLKNKLQTLSSEYNEQGTIADPYTRIQRQSETLNEMINIKDLLRKNIKSMTPKPFQSRAQNLFQFIEDKLNFNEKGELINDDGTTMEGSNISDLIQHSIRDRRRNIVPIGWSKFLTVLRESNAPRMIMNYDTLEELDTPLKLGFKRKLSKRSEEEQLKIKQELMDTPIIATNLKKEAIKHPKKEVRRLTDESKTRRRKPLSPESKSRRRKQPERYDEYLLHSKKYF